MVVVVVEVEVVVEVDVVVEVVVVVVSFPISPIQPFSRMDSANIRDKIMLL